MCMYYALSSICATYLDCVKQLQTLQWILKACMFMCFRAVIGEIDEETDSALDLGNIRAEPLNSVVH